MADPYASLGAPVDDDPYASLGAHVDGPANTVGSFGERFARGAGEPLMGAMQVGANLGSSISGNPSLRSVADSTNQTVRDYLAKSDAMAPQGIDWARLGGNVSVTAPMAVLGGEAIPASLALRPLAMSAAQGAVGGGITGLIAPVKGDDYGTEKLRQVALGAGLGGVASPVLGNALSRVIRPQTSENVRSLLDEGIELTPGQILGGSAKRLEDGAMSIPFVGGSIRNARQRSIDSFDRAAVNRALEPIGRQLPANLSGREAVAYTRAALGDSYDRLLPQIQFRPDQQFASEMQNIVNMTRNGTLPEAQANQFEAILRDRLIAKMTPQGNMNGEAFKVAEEGLKKDAKAYLSSADPDQRALGEALRSALETTRGTLMRSNPQIAQELGNINRGYATYALLRRAASSLGADEGSFTPAQLQNAVRSADGSVGKGSFARGDALMQDLSEAGKMVIPSKVPDSGTTERVLTNAVLGGGAAAAVMAPALLGKALVGGLVTRGAYSRPGQNILRALLTERPNSANALARLIDTRPNLVGLPLLSAGVAASEQ